MKCIFILTLVGLVHIHANILGQQISLSLQDATVKQALKEIEKQCDFVFMYDFTKIDVNKAINIRANNETVENVLKQITRETNSWYEIIDKQIVLIPRQKVLAEAMQQGITITGTVTDEAGAPMPGVNVVVKGTTIGQVTDVNGMYSINVPDKATVLVFSFIGYTPQEMVVADHVKIDIVLVEDSKLIEEVVVIGYGTARKRDLAGSVVRADLNTLKDSPNISLTSALQGTVPGLNVGAVTTAGSNPSVSIRGLTSISGTQSPLIVLDGIIFRGSMVDINPNDIESIDILKDASAAAIYGSQASNGVILMTSKSPKVIGKPILEYSGSYTIQGLTNKNLIPMNRDGFLQFLADRFLEESRTGDDLSQPNPNWDVTLHLMDANAIAGYMDGTDTDWWDIFTNDHPYIQSHDLSLRGKTELNSYYVSVGYTGQENLIVNDIYKRYNVRVNLDMKVTDWLKLGTQSFFTMSDYSGATPALDNVKHLVPLAKPTDEYGEIANYPYLNIYNPMKTIMDDDLQKRYNLMGNFYLDMDIPFIKGLNYRLNFSQNLVTNKTFTFKRKDENDLANGSKANSSQYDWTADNIVTYKRRFGKHDIAATFVYGAEKRQFESTGASGTNYVNSVLGYNYLQGARTDLQVITSNAWQETSLYSMLRLSYIFNDRYIFTGTVRRDGFSGFGKDNKFGIFPSAAVAWRISEEEFIRDQVNWLNDMKLRLSYGVNGNRTVSRYQTLARVAFTDAYLFGDGANAEKGVNFSSMANPDLKWESTKTFNVGLDFSLLGYRLYGTLDHYRASTYDMLYGINLPNYNMVWSNTGNMGELENRGIEISVTGVPVKTDNFSWDITFNFSRNRNKVVSITGIDADGDGKEDDLISSNIFMNHPYGVIYDFRQTGMWQMEDHLAGRIPAGFSYGTYKIADLDGDGNITSANDREILGYTDPAYRFSIQNTFRYKNWEFKFFINSIQGGKDYYYGRPGSDLANPDYMMQYNNVAFDYWTPENPDARYRQIGFYPAAIGSAYAPLVKRNFIRLQDVTLSYTFPEKWLNAMKINNLRIYATGKNLFTISDWDGWDPETGTGITGSFPLLRSYSIGLNFSF